MAHPVRTTRLKHLTAKQVHLKNQTQTPQLRRPCPTLYASLPTLDTPICPVDVASKHGLPASMKLGLRHTQIFVQHH